MLTTVLMSARRTYKSLPGVALLALALTSGLGLQPAKAADYDQRLGTVQAFTQDNAKFEWQSAELKPKGSEVIYNFGGKHKLSLNIPKGDIAGFMLTDLPKNPAGNTILTGSLNIYLKATHTKPLKDVTIRFWIAPDLSHPNDIKVVDMQPRETSNYPDNLGPTWTFSVFRSEIAQKVNGLVNVKKVTVFVKASEDREVVVNGVNFEYEYPGMNRFTRPGTVVLTNAGPLAFKSP